MKQTSKCENMSYTFYFELMSNELMLMGK